MVYINRRQYARSYREILSASRAASEQQQEGGSSSSSSNGGHAVSVLILVAPDVDALCACRILTALLKHDQVGYNVVPVSGWAELSRVNHEMVDGNARLRTVVLLNLGSLVDLAQYFNLSPQTTLHVIDSHRPCNLDNLFSAMPDADRVVVWDDGDVDEDMKEEKEAFEALQYEPESDSEEEYEDTDDEDLHWRERQRRLLADSDESSSEGEDEDEEDDQQEQDGSEEDEEGRSTSSSSRGKRRRLDEEGNEVESGGETSRPSTKRKTKTSKRKKKRRSQGEDGDGQPKRLSRRRKQLHQTRIQKYYASGTWYGQSVSGQLYILATLLRRSDNDYLWMAILGLTYQFTANLIDREKYDSYASLLVNEVERLNIGAPAARAPLNGLMPHSLAAPYNPDDRSIRQSDEFRFMLFRHWNLYDSMYHSGYVAGKMKLWRDRGRKNLQGLLAKMGFSLEQCRQSYAHMDMDLKRSLRTKVEGIAPEYGLYDLAYPSFIRAHGYQAVLSASDVSECIAALLEVANGVRLDFGNEVGGAVWSGSKAWNSSIGKEDVAGEDEVPSSDKENQATNGEGHQNAAAVNGAVARQEEAAAVAAAKAKKREEAWWVRNFWMAYDALGQDTTLLRSSLPLSMALHRAIIRQGISILDKQAIKTLRSFRFCIIKEGPDLPVFAHPATLSRLGTWLVDAVRDLLEGSNSAAGKARVKALPFILAALDEKRDAFLVVGITGAAEYGDVRKNRFGLAFQEAAQTSGTRTRHDKFEASVVEVRKDDLAAFINRVHIKL